LQCTNISGCKKCRGFFAVSLLRFAVYISPSDAWILASHNTLVKNVAEMCSVVDPGCLFRILDPNFSIPDPGSKRSRIRIRLKEFKYFNPKIFSSFRKYDLGCPLRNSDLDLDFFPISDPGSRGQKSTGFRNLGSATKNRIRYLICRYLIRKSFPFGLDSDPLISEKYTNWQNWQL
jgi:hypothetical protein